MLDPFATDVTEDGIIGHAKEKQFKDAIERHWQEERTVNE